MRDKSRKRPVFTEVWMTDRYRRFRRARARLVKLFAQIIRLVDELERERTVSPPE